MLKISPKESLKWISFELKIMIIITQFCKVKIPIIFLVETWNRMKRFCLETSKGITTSLQLLSNKYKGKYWQYTTHFLNTLLIIDWNLLKIDNTSYLTIINCNFVIFNEFQSTVKCIRKNLLKSILLMLL